MTNSVNINKYKYKQIMIIVKKYIYPTKKYYNKNKIIYIFAAEI